MIEEKNVDGKISVRFQPVEAWETSESVDKLCEAYLYVITRTDADPLLIIPMFVLDFCVFIRFGMGTEE